MTDEREKPRRLQTATERELASERSLRERETYRKTPPKGIPAEPWFDLAAPHEVPKEITGVYEGDELRQMREEREPLERVRHLELKHDALASVVTETRVIVGEMKGQLEILPKLVDAIRKSAEQREQRETVTWIKRTEVESAEQLDEIDARKAKRNFLLKSAGAIVGLITSYELVHRLIAWIAGHL